VRAGAQGERGGFPMAGEAASLAEIGSGFGLPAAAAATRRLSEGVGPGAVLDARASSPRGRLCWGNGHGQARGRRGLLR
jgi:hypothetical protein